MFNKKKKTRRKLSKKRPEKKLLKSFKKRAGRSSSGRITVRHRGGGAKRRYRLIDFGQEGMNEKARVIAVEYDPCRTADIVLLRYENRGKRYRLASQDIKIGDEVIVAEKAEIKIGNRMRLENIPIGTSVFNIELVPDERGKIVRSAGTAAEVLGQEGRHVHLKMPSREIRKVSKKCFATIGRVSNTEHRFKKLRKAGQTRLKGRRPQVRGTAMPAGPHPHGGGEGRAPIGLPHPKTPWGKIARGGKTRRRKSTNKYIIKRRNA